MRPPAAILVRIPLLLAILACVSVMAMAQVGQIGRGGNYFAGTGCGQDTALQARMDGGQNAAAVTAAVCGMVSDGSWAQLVSLYNFKINSSANALLNWITNARNATVNGAAPCTFSANNGYTGTASCFINTTTTGSGQTQNSASLGVCDETANAGGTVTQMGASDNSIVATQISLRNTSYGSKLNSAIATLNTNTITNSKGAYFISRTGSAGYEQYVAGAPTNAVTQVSTNTVSILNYYISALNNNGSASAFATDQIGYAFIGAGLSDAQALSIYNRLHTYIGAIGATSSC